MRVMLFGMSRSGTTITRDIMSSHPAIWLTNELRTYNVVQDKKGKLYHCTGAGWPPGDYFRFIEKKIGNNYFKFPPGVNRKDFRTKCQKHLKGDSLVDKFEAAEAAIFNNKFKIVGDKTGIGFEIFETLANHGIEMKFIHIYRDGRDVVSSGIRHSKGGKSNKLWAQNDAYKNSEHWASGMLDWHRAKGLFREEDFIEIKFEDFIDKPEVNIVKISELLGVNSKGFKLNIFNKNKTNRGYFKKFVPNWKETFAPEALELLKKLEYIK